MRYFLLHQREGIKHPLVIDKLEAANYPYNITGKDWEKIPEMAVAYFKNSAVVEVPEILKLPTMMLGNALVELLLLYEPELQYKGITVFSDNIEDKLGYLYWVIQCKEAECLHESCKVYPNGMVEEIKLDGSKIPDAPVFKIGGIVQNTLIVNFSVAESILRRNWYGIGLTEVEVI